MNVAPGAAYTSRLALGVAQTGLVGTVRYRLLDNDTTVDDPVYGPSTSGIIEDPTGTGSYLFHGTAPSVAGDYSPAWDMGVGTDLVYDDDLVVTYSAASSVAPTGRDLCSLADVVELVPGYSVGDDTATDSLLQDLLTAESRDAMERTGREIVAITGRNPRSFDVDYTVARLRRCQIGDLASVNSVTILNAQGATVQTVDLDGVVLEPRVREDWQPVGTLWFRWDATTPANLFFGNVLVVDAVWGFPQIPDTVRKAVARLTVVRYLNDAVSQGTRFSEAADRADFNIAASIRWSLDVLDRFYVPIFQSTGDWNTGNLPTGVAGVDW